VIVSPELDGRKPEAVDVHELAHPRPRAVVDAHQVIAVGLVPGELLPRVGGAPGCLVEVVVDARILAALNEERVKAGT
jgi:hypothetical protein